MTSVAVGMVPANDAACFTMRERINGEEEGCTEEGRNQEGRTEEGGEEEVCSEEVGRALRPSCPSRDH